MYSLSHADDLLFFVSFRCSRVLDIIFPCFFWLLLLLLVCLSLLYFPFFFVSSAVAAMPRLFRFFFRVCGYVDSCFSGSSSRKSAAKERQNRKKRGIEVNCFSARLCPVRFFILVGLLVFLHWLFFSYYDVSDWCCGAVKPNDFFDTDLLFFLLVSCKYTRKRKKMRLSEKGNTSLKKKSQKWNFERSYMSEAKSSTNTERKEDHRCQLEKKIYLCICRYFSIFRCICMCIDWYIYIKIYLHI